MSSAAGEKRKFEQESSSRKRIALDKGSQLNSPARQSGVDFSNSEGISNKGPEYWMIQWRAPQYKKHKTWDGDAVLVLNGIKGTLYDLEGKFMGAGSLNAPKAVEGGEYTLGGKEIGIDHAISRADYFSGSCFGRGAVISSIQPQPSSSKPSKQFTPLKPGGLGTPYKTPLVGKKGIPLHPVDLVSTKSSSTKTQGQSSHWTANWRKPQAKKHKTWDGDAFVSFAGEKLTVISDRGKILGHRDWDGLPLYSGYSFRAGGKEIELDSQVNASQMPAITGTMVTEAEHDVPESSQLSSNPAFSFRVANTTVKNENESDDIANVEPSKGFVPPTSFYGQAPKKLKLQGPLHDPEVEGAIVMKAPTKEHSNKYNKKNLPIVPVVLDPIIARYLRPHQVEGVRFLYDCVMGLRKHEGQGCILADEMGLGKTLQTIMLVWTLLKQNPYAGVGPVIGKALIVCPVSLVNNWRAEFHKWLGRDRVGVFTGDKDKAVIKQFINSCVKLLLWLSPIKNRRAHYRRIHQVLIIGYERLRTVIADLAYCNPPIGLIICDEGHRLKSANNKTSTMFRALRTPRRIILSGTPIQNDLSEFHAMVRFIFSSEFFLLDKAQADFCNPGLLDDYTTFRRVYEVPILRSRAPDCTDKDTEIGEARSSQLSTIAKSFVLRREATILKNYLPPKHEYVVFVTPTRLQLSIFSTILNADKLDNIIQSSTAESLALINVLTKVSNSPILLKATADKAKALGNNSFKQRGIEEALKLLPGHAQIEDFSLSGKLSALSNLLKTIREYTDEKCIIVSHYTSTLNIIEAFCMKKSYTYFRLDGQTPAAKRQEYVNIFNKSSQYSRFLFLLSSKAGGVGLNLIGASRLCLIDSDWNPSHDLQSMARIHRDGQKRPVFIYRFLTAEKIYQRQVTKIGLSNSLMGSGTSGSKSDSFSRKDLRDIFRIHPNTACNTHDLLECPCGTSNKEVLTEVRNTIDCSQAGDLGEDSGSEMGFVTASQVKPEKLDKMDKAYLRKKKAELAALGEWKHVNCLRSLARDDIRDDILRRLIYTLEPEDMDKNEEYIKQQTRLDSLLSAVDIDNVTALEKETAELTVRDVPGGTVSFLFEKTSTSKLDDGGADFQEPEGANA
ncbi:hypothetical protein SERLA73DRAFT_72346 [Serpula lacrymans var. lacrymans S7.3]|uniref:Uncharacterized protein n=2 Tax=Serpula lacrymans var. lacrymans TaxID=341189 RepID=F8PVH3_SERL3|nr:uncharacterized protein SERLADRAFT_436866 [Serpula lacrymans var. lacrymans S7.9]EGN99526.1 hypothetical protein SERLA73DRAFT_72346 [Serpula lacrymans var. lacrymans S7.3]EGO25099.1 hypothetical protein SERLADRAFT_436866 [Serpula lacrymans var. lacrymans S7.9]